MNLRSDVEVRTIGVSNTTPRDPRAGIKHMKDGDYSYDILEHLSVTTKLPCNEGFYKHDHEM